MSEYAPYLDAYTHLREHLSALHMRLVERLSPRVVKQARRKLGLHRGGITEEAAETATVVLFDYALYHYRPDGRTLFEAYFEAHPPVPGSHDDQLRQALATYRYTLFEVEGVEEGVGVEVYDYFQQQPFFLMDRSLARRGVEGLSIAAGTLWTPEYALTTGAALPVDPATQERIEQELTLRFGALDALEVDALRPAEAADLAAIIIRIALRKGAGEGIAYR